MKPALLLSAVLLVYGAGKAQPIFFEFEKPLAAQMVNVRKMNSSYNYVLFIGKGDSLYSIDMEGYKIPYDYFYQPLEWSEENNEIQKKLKDVALQITVDTANNVLIPFYQEVPEDLPGDQIVAWIDRNRTDVIAYPLYIWNLSNSTTSIPVEGVTTNLIQEALDENGKWRPIEYRTTGFCGNGMWEYILEPGYFAITGIYKYTGNFCTKIRVKFRRADQVYYSNIFKGCINKEQFTLDEYFHTPENFLER